MRKLRWEKLLLMVLAVIWLWGWQAPFATGAEQDAVPKSSAPRTMPGQSESEPNPIPNPPAPNPPAPNQLPPGGASVEDVLLQAQERRRQPADLHTLVAVRRVAGERRTVERETAQEQRDHPHRTLQVYRALTIMGRAPRRVCLPWNDPTKGDIA